MVKGRGARGAKVRGEGLGLRVGNLGLDGPVASSQVSPTSFIIANRLACVPVRESRLKDQV
jgi:hypothetical protein